MTTSSIDNAVPARPLPLLDPDNEHFWTSGKTGRLAILRCNTCGYFIHPGVPPCPKCLSHDCTPTPVSGRAKLISYTINRHLWLAGFEPPYAIGLVELVEQPALRLITNVVGIALEELEFDMELAVRFEQYDDIWIPVFGPVAS